MKLRLALLGIAFVVLGGCGDIVHQTRYIPRHSELTWSEDHEQLPWQPPSKHNQHLVRNGKPAKPGWAHETQHDVGTDPVGFHYAGWSCCDAHHIKL